MDIREIRELKSMTQQDLANAIGRDRSLITKIENGVATPSVATAKAIANVLGIEWTIFFKEIGEDSSLDKNKNQ